MSDIEMQLRVPLRAMSVFMNESMIVVSSVRVRFGVHMSGIDTVPPIDLSSSHTYWQLSVRLGTVG